MGKKGSEVSASKRYPLRSAHGSGRVLRSALTKNDKASGEPPNDSAAAQPAAKKTKGGSRSWSPNNSVRLLRSASKNKDEACSAPLNDSSVREPGANKRKRANPSKIGSPSSSIRVLRSASKNTSDACSEPVNECTLALPAVNQRKGVSPSKVEGPNKSVRVLRSASKNKSEADSETLNDSNVSQPAAKRSKSGSPLKVGSPVSNARVLRSTSGMKNELFDGPLNDSNAAQPAVRKRKSGTPPKTDNPKIGVRVLRSSSERKHEACHKPPNGSTAAQPAARERTSSTPSKTNSTKVGVRVLRSASGKKNEASSEPLNDSTSAEPAVRKRKGGRASKDRSPKKGYLKICQRVRYILNRMNYEQSLIQAYASDGWKGQSSEKLRPEKELERARSEIIRCKLRIREAFQNMDSLLSEGKLEESLFDCAGEISSEDIFCAICDSKDVTLENDIILCDGACDRGFHQNCLNPPLLTEDIPPGDEGWLCPACVCKADCIDALNELQGSKLSIHDSWEKVFPEAASLVNGSEQVDASDLPAYNTEDNDYNPASTEGLMVNEDRFKNGGKVDDLGLPSEDSEDDDFNPAGPDSSEDQKKESDSEESDFTSDSDDFCAEIAKSFGKDEVSASPLSNVINHTDTRKIRVINNHSNEENSAGAFTEMELEQGMVLPISSRRQVERLDYKKLYDEAYGKQSSDSSEDEDWSGEELLEGSETDSLGERLHPAKRCSRRLPAGQQSNEHTPQRDRLHGLGSEQQTEIHRSNVSTSAARKHHFDPTVTQKLKVHFEKDPYPSRAIKESLAQELGLTYNQVCRWFSSTRHYLRVASAKKEKHQGNQASENNDSATVDCTQTREPNAGVMEKLTVNRNDMGPKEPMEQNNFNQCNKAVIPLSGTEIEMESYGQESTDSSDEEWTAFSTPRKGRSQDNETGSLAESLSPAKRSSRRTPARQQNDEHTRSEHLEGSSCAKQTEVLRSNGSNNKTSKYHFGPIVSQKLKVHFEKDPYPSRPTKESLAQELGLTFNQVSKWFSATRHYSRDAAAKNKKHPGKDTVENNDSATFGGIQVREPNHGLMEKPTADINDMISQKLMVEINLNEGIEEDIPPSQYTRCEESAISTPTAFSREVGPPGYGPRPGESFLEVGGCSRNTNCDKSVPMTPIAISREVGPPGYTPGENQANGIPLNISSEQRVFMSPTTISRGVAPPGYGPGENQGIGTSLNTTCKQGAFMSPTTFSTEVGPPGYGPGETQGIGTSWNTGCEQVFMSPTAISREVGPPGYGPGENLENGTSWNTRCERTMFTFPTSVSREVGPPGYGPGEIQGQGNFASWTSSCKQRMFTSPTTTSSEAGPPGYGPVDNQGSGGSRNINLEARVVPSLSTISREVFPPGYEPGENRGNGAQGNVRNPQGKSAEKVEFSDEARKKAIQRELRRRQKFR